MPEAGGGGNQCGQPTAANKLQKGNPITLPRPRQWAEGDALIITGDIPLTQTNEDISLCMEKLEKGI